MKKNIITMLTLLAFIVQADAQGLLLADAEPPNYDEILDLDNASDVRDLTSPTTVTLSVDEGGGITFVGWDIAKSLWNKEVQDATPLMKVPVAAKEVGKEITENVKEHPVQLLGTTYAIVRGVQGKLPDDIDSVLDAVGLQDDDKSTPQIQGNPAGASGVEQAGQGNTAVVRASECPQHVRQEGNNNRFECDQGRPEPVIQIVPVPTDSTGAVP